MKIAWACSILAFALVGASSHAQQDISRASVFLGPFGGFEFALQSGRIPVYGLNADCGEFTSGTAGITSAGALLSLPGLFTGNLGLTLAGGVSRSTGLFTTTPTGPTTIADKGRIIRLEREYRLNHEFLRFNIDLLATFHPLDRLELAAGASVGYQTSASFTQTDNITSPDDYAFPDGQTSRDIVGGAILSGAGVQFGPRIRMAYRLPLGSRLWLQPALTAHADLLSPVRESSWQRFGVGGGAAILFDLIPPPPEPVPAAVVDLPISPPRLAASIELYGVDEDNLPRPVATIKVDEELYRQNTPLLPVIYFERNGSGLPTRYEGITHAGADSFALESLSGTGMLEMQHRALDVIGWRLRADTGARITLIGSASHDEPASLARTRCETIRSYMERVWGISRERITLGTGSGGGHLQRSSETSEDGRADNRRVEIVASAPGIIAPIVTEQVVRNFNPPVIRVLPSFEAEAGIRSWTVTISQEKNIVARYSNQPEHGADESELSWNIIHDRIDSALAPLVAELTVEDSLGATTTVRATIPLELEKRLRVVDGRVDRQDNSEQIGHTLVAFNYNSAELSPQHILVLEEIARQVRDSARITIIGYTDRIGDERYNVGLSTQRAEQAASALQAQLRKLGTRDVKIKPSGAGMETERFTNDLPEGRALSRGVTVVIEQEPLSEHTGP